MENILTDFITKNALFHYIFFLNTTEKTISYTYIDAIIRMLPQNMQSNNVLSCR